MTGCPACNGKVCTLTRSLFDDSEVVIPFPSHAGARYADWTEVHAGHFVYALDSIYRVVHRDAGEGYCIVSVNHNPLTVYDISALRPWAGDREEDGSV